MVIIRIIDMFMWGYQDFFQTSINTSAERLFNKLKRGFGPRTFLIGIWEEEGNPTTYDVCVEPEDVGYERALFSQVKDIAKEIESKDPERKVFHSHPSAQQDHERKIYLRAIRAAIKSILAPLDEQQKVVSYVAFPTKVKGYLVFAVLQLDKAAVDSLYSLHKSIAEGRYPVSTSLLDAVITEFLENCSKALQKPDPGKDLHVLEREADEIIRNAGNRVMVGLAWRIHGCNFRLFELCNLISAQRYEGAEGNGKLIIAERNHPSIIEVITFHSPVQLENYQKVRKIVEMAVENLCLLSNGDEVYGLGYVKEYDIQQENVFIVNFTKHFTWSLIHHDTIMMLVEYGQPQLRKEKLIKETFLDHMSRLFSSTSEEAIHTLWEVLVAATEQKHGTMVVISSGAEAEMKRLKNQSTPIMPIKMNSEIMKAVTSIDGAVLLDPNGYCFALGVILDGLATEKGDSARGARFNSAIRYIESQAYECLIIVVSEDGYINLIPELKPRIPRRYIDMALTDFRHLNEEREINQKKFNQTMGLFQQLRFYLLEDDCREINQLRKEMEGRLESQIRIGYDDLFPNPDMNESYYL